MYSNLINKHMVYYYVLKGGEHRSPTVINSGSGTPNNYFILPLKNYRLWVQEPYFYCTLLS